MITSASKALLFALVLSAGSAIAAGQLELGTCDTQRQRCVDRCGLSTPSFDCDMSENGMALAFSCACTDGGTNVDMPTPVVVANTDSASNTEDSHTRTPNMNSQGNQIQDQVQLKIFMLLLLAATVLTNAAVNRSTDPAARTAFWNT